MFLKGWDLQVGAKSPPEPHLGHQLPSKYSFFRNLFRLCFFIKFWGPTREAQGQGTLRWEGSAPR